MNQSKLSVIIPTFNEEDQIGGCINSLREQSQYPPYELIVVDGGSEDRTVEIARAARCTVLSCEHAHRAVQLNLGARRAVGEACFFIHADARPPEGYAAYIRDALIKGFDFGCFAYRFDRSGLLMQLNSYLTKYNGLLAGGGDQGLFVRSELFDQIGGYDESHLLMEDFDLYRRLQRVANGVICPHRMTVSARKYRKNGYFRVQIANLLVFVFYHFGASQSTLSSLYGQLLK